MTWEIICLCVMCHTLGSYRSTHVLECSCLKIIFRILDLMGVFSNVLENIISTVRLLGIHFFQVLATQTVDDFIMFCTCELFLINLQNLPKMFLKKCCFPPKKVP